MWDGESVFISCILIYYLPFALHSRQGWEVSPVAVFSMVLFWCRGVHVRVEQKDARAL